MTHAHGKWQQRDDQSLKHMIQELCNLQAQLVSQKSWVATESIQAACADFEHLRSDVQKLHASVQSQSVNVEIASKLAKEVQAEFKLVEESTKAGDERANALAAGFLEQVSDVAGPKASSGAQQTVECLSGCLAAAHGELEDMMGKLGVHLRPELDELHSKSAALQRCVASFDEEMGSQLLQANHKQDIGILQSLCKDLPGDPEIEGLQAELHMHRIKDMERTAEARAWEEERHSLNAEILSLFELIQHGARQAPKPELGAMEAMEAGELVAMEANPQTPPKSQTPTSVETLPDTFTVFEQTGCGASARKQRAPRRRFVRLAAILGGSVLVLTGGVGTGLWHESSVTQGGTRSLKMAPAAFEPSHAGDHRA